MPILVGVSAQLIPRRNVLQRGARAIQLCSVALCLCCSQEPPTPLSEATKESDLTCLRTLSSRVLPEMFNTYLKVSAVAALAVAAAAEAPTELVRGIIPRRGGEEFVCLP